MLPNFTMIRVDTDELPLLRTKLAVGMPKTNGLRVSIRNVLEGRVRGHFYTDQCHSSVIFQCVRPSVSVDGDLHCYTTSKRNLVTLLEQGNFLTSGKQHYMYIVEDEEIGITEHLIENIQIDGRLMQGSEYSVVKSALYVMDTMVLPPVEVPPGYRLRKMNERDGKVLLNQRGLWINSVNFSYDNKFSYVQQCILNLPTWAVHEVGDTSKLVSGAMCYSMSGEIGSLFTVEDHKRKGLASLVIRCAAQEFIQHGDLPYISIDNGNQISVALHEKLGFVFAGELRNLFLNIHNR